MAGVRKGRGPNWLVMPGRFTRCRLCYAVVPPHLGWIYFPELTDVERRYLCHTHRSAIDTYLDNHEE